MRTEKICVIGLGYIGLPTAAVFARAGYDVVGVDVNEKAVKLINQGLVHIEETGLPELIQEVVAKGKLRATLTPEHADVFIIAVPTPNHADHTANLDYVVAAVHSILPYVRSGNVVIVESTIPPRTIDDIVAPVFKQNGWNLQDDLYLAHCPERVLPGRILIELIENTRIVGGYTPEAAFRAAEVYRKIVKGEVLETNAVNAEMSKLMENTYRDVNIALANELAKISDKLGINALEVIQLANRHPRVNLHQPGPGVGGHCIAVDPYFIIEKAPDETPLIAIARKINNSMPQFVVDHVEKIASPASSKIAVFGLAYKGNTDDVRESPSIEVIKLLLQKGYDLSYHDPHVRQEHIDYPLVGFEEAIHNADCLLILTDHAEFKSLEETAILSRMRRPIIFDTKNCVTIQSNEIVLFNYGNLYEMNKMWERISI